MPLPKLPLQPPTKLRKRLKPAWLPKRQSLRLALIDSTKYSAKRNIFVILTTICKLRRPLQRCSSEV